MTKIGKTFKDLKELKSLKHEKEPKPAEKGGHRNLIKEALEEELDVLFPKEEEKDELPEV
jgi:hypothetical protein